ncbi:MAG TPA: IPT/TIG domain-containing protein [Verrucomicrobiae bacterium]|nr:IPT/TIG domain-containing protein [Verrucomicrobiae bacterium]
MSSPITVSVTPENGFSGTVQVTLAGMPSGIISNPASPFSVAAGQNAAVVFGAAINATTGQFSVTAQGTSGTLSHFSVLSLSIQVGSAQNLPRSNYVRNDSVLLLDSPAGEPHRRHVIYDSGAKRFFVVNRAMNRVEVFSSSATSLQATMDAPGASSVDLSTDGTTLWVGTTLEQILAVNTTSLQVATRYPVAGLTPIPNIVFDRPNEVLSLATGKLLVRLRQPSASEALLALWDPAAHVFTNLTPAAPALFQNGVGVMARSADHTRVIVASNDSTGEIAVFDSNGNLLTGPKSLGTGAISFASANPDGSRFAVVFGEPGASQVFFLDGNLNSLGSYSSPGAAGIVFSRDGQTLYVGEPLGNGHVVTALSVPNFQKLGQIPDLTVEGIPTVLEDVDETQLLVGLSNRGLNFLDAASPATLPPNAPVFASAPVAQPAEGTNTGGASIILNGFNFSSNPQVRFGAQSTVNATATNSTQLQVSSPPSAASGPVNLTAYFSNGWIAVAPAAFSYGPAILQVFPDAGSQAGGDTLFLLGFGLGASTANLSVTIGGAAAMVQKVESLPGFASALSLDTTYPFSLERITVTTPPGSPGNASISITAPSGTTTAPKSFQYLSTSATFPHSGLYKFLLNDPQRQQVYLSSTDHVDVFDRTGQEYRGPIEPPPNGPPPNAGLRGLALTPDRSQLIVADFGAQSVYLISPDGVANNGTKVPVGGVVGYANSGPARVATTSASTVFVGLSGEGGATGGCNSCLGQMDLTASPPTLQPAPQPEVSSLTGAPLLQADSAGDTVYLAFGTAPGGPVAQWTAAVPNAFTVSSANDSSYDLSTSADGTLFAMRSKNSTEIRGADLSLFSTPVSAELETIPGRVSVPGVALHPSGALLYDPFLDGPPPSAPPAQGIRGGIDIRDAHSGRLRLRIYLPEPFAMLSTDVDGLHGSFLTTDENGEYLFALTTSGLTVIHLAKMPLGIGSLSPSFGAAGGGTSITIRGSGFQSTTTATLGGKSANVTFKDKNTLLMTTPVLSAGPQQLILSNLDGESVSLDAAFVAQ